MAALLPCRPSTRSPCRSKKKCWPPTNGVRLCSLLRTLVVLRATCGWKLLFWTLKTRPLILGSSTSALPQETRISGKPLSTRLVIASGKLRSSEMASLSNLIHLLGKNDELTLLARLLRGVFRAQWRFIRRFRRIDSELKDDN